MRSVKLVVLSIFVVALSLAGNLQAANPQFTDADLADHLWGTAGNWDTGSVPLATDNPHIVRANPGVIIPSGYTAVGAHVFMAVGEWAGGEFAAMTIEAGGALTLTGGLNLAAGGLPATATVTNSGDITAPAGIMVGYQSSGDIGIFNMNGGTATTNGHIVVGRVNGSTGTFNLNDGSVSTGGLFVLSNPGGTGTLNMTGGTLNVGSWFEPGYRGPNPGIANISGGTINTGNGARIGEGGNGLVNMTGGILNANDFSIGTFAGGTGHLQLDGGTIFASLFAIGEGIGTMDINGSGKLIIDGDITGLIAGYIDSGWITTTYGGGVLYDYDITTPLKTTVYVPEPATIALLGLGGLLLRKRRV